ncbi:MAG: alkaline phosphatase family protein [Thermodesulfobacteriota bacterium]
MKNRVFVFGIDGGTFSVIRPAVAAGRLPVLGRLLAEGAHGDLESTVQPITPMAWSSFATGVNAGKHGIFDFARLEGGRPRLNTAGDRAAPAVWSLLSAAGRPATVVNVPFTYPPEEIHGIMIPGFDAPRVERAIFHPEALYDELTARFGPYRLDWTFPIGQRLDLERYLQTIRDTVRHRGDTGLYLLDRQPWDLFVIVFTSTDHAQHVFWQHPEGQAIIEGVYAEVDRQLGRFLAALPPDVTVLVMSDHGAGPIRHLVYLDNWLAREGFLARPAAAGAGSLARRAKSALRRLLPTGLRKALRAGLPGVKNRLDRAILRSGVDWSQTRAYASGMYGNIRLNLQGREPEGIVPPADYDRVCREIMDRLATLTDPASGQPLVAAVRRRHELYHGPCLDQAPDLVIVWQDYACFTKKGIDQGETIFGDRLMVDASDYPHTGTHRLEGIFLAHGPGVAPQAGVQARIIDLAPTILALLGEPVPAHMDGRVLAEVFPQLAGALPAASGGAAGQGPALKKGAAVTPEEKEALIERLKSLGYIEEG